jgi:hypothetical protein
MEEVAADEEGEGCAAGTGCGYYEPSIWWWLVVRMGKISMDHVPIWEAKDKSTEADAR